MAPGGVPFKKMFENVDVTFFPIFFQKTTDYSRMRARIKQINIVGDSFSDDETFNPIEFCVGGPSQEIQILRRRDRKLCGYHLRT